MMNSAQNAPEAGQLGIYYPPPRTQPSGPLLVATDGGAPSDAAFRAALALREKLSADVEVVGVVEPLPMIVPEAQGLLQPLVVTPEHMTALKTKVRTQLDDAGVAGSKWPITVLYGRPAREITDLARQNHSQLIVIGLTHHGVIDRILDGETALEVLRQSEVPVLLASGFESLPRQAVFAVDFSAQSMNAARAGLRLVSADCFVNLVHVRPSVTVFDGTGMWEVEYDKAAERELEKFAEALAAPAGIETKPTILRGRPANAIADFARNAGADLIVAGTRGAGLMRRILVGSVATGLVHKATTSVLIVPDRVGARTERIADSLHADADPATRSEWAAKLSEFSKRNAARRATLEIDDPAIGSQSEVVDFPFLGADYDRQSGRVEIMLGEFTGSDRHLTHSMERISSIDILKDETGKDMALRVAYEGGQALVLFGRENRSKPVAKVT